LRQAAQVHPQRTGIAGLIALGLFGPIVGMKTITGRSNDLVLSYEWGQVAVIVALVFLGRLLLQRFVWTTNRPITAGFGQVLSRLPAGVMGRIAAPIFLALAFAIPVYTVYFAPVHSRDVIGVGTLILTYVMLGWGLNIVVGLAGLLDPGPAPERLVARLALGVLPAEERLLQLLPRLEIRPRDLAREPLERPAGLLVYAREHRPVLRHALEDPERRGELRGAERRRSVVLPVGHGRTPYPAPRPAAQGGAGGRPGTTRITGWSGGAGTGPRRPGGGRAGDDAVATRCSSPPPCPA
jgi:hypothetical protein